MSQRATSTSTTSSAEPNPSGTPSDVLAALVTALRQVPAAMVAPVLPRLDRVDFDSFLAFQEQLIGAPPVETQNGALRLEVGSLAVFRPVFTRPSPAPPVSANEPSVSVPMETMCVMSPTLALLPVGKLLSANSVAVEKADLSLGQFAGARLSAAPAPPVPDVPRPAPRGCFRHGGFLPGGSCPGGGGRHAIGSGSGGSLACGWRCASLACGGRGASLACGGRCEWCGGSRSPLALRLWPHSAAGTPSADSSDEESSASSVPSLEFLGESTPAPNALTLAAYLARNPLRSSSAGLVSTPPLVGEPAAAPPSRLAGGPPAVSATCTPLPAAPLLAGVPPVATATCTPVPSGCAFGLPSSQLGQGGALSSAPACGSLSLPPGTSPEVALLFRLMEERFAALAAQTGGAAVVPPGVLPPAKESYKDYLRRVGVPEDRGSLTPLGFPLGAPLTPPEECARGGETADAQRRREVDSRRIRTHVQFLLLKARGLELTRLGLKGLEAALPGAVAEALGPDLQPAAQLVAGVVAAQINAEASTETNKLRKIWAAVVSWSKLKAWIAKKLSERSLYADQPAVQAKLPDPARLLWAPEVVAAQLDGQKATVEGDKVERASPAVAKGLSAPSGPAIVSRSARARSPIAAPLPPEYDGVVPSIVSGAGRELMPTCVDISRPGGLAVSESLFLGPFRSPEEQALAAGLPQVT
ncbi:hypothetical protein PAPYR_6771 [Paratrimastix pyriformis]|uniref:Uncharacterized protein n=1 Tax=Paratrimastix pyriformis TaxID=342808 RepID=A0ABQ8UJV4_9EUKA|nr:hypothetical protein PAPYR_6771 [Paratrimastix pyriformis]